MKVIYLIYNRVVLFRAVNIALCIATVVQRWLNAVSYMYVLEQNILATLQNNRNSVIWSLKAQIPFSYLVQ